jgi:hypothetical protein
LSWATKDQEATQIPTVADCCTVGERLYAVCLNGQHLLRLDMETMETDVIPLPASETHYTGLCHDGRRFWIAPRDKGPVLTWDGGDGFAALTEYPPGFTCGETAFVRCYYLQGSVWLTPNDNANMTVRIAPETQTMVAAAEKPTGLYTFCNWMGVVGDEILAPSCASRAQRLNAGGEEVGTFVFHYYGESVERAARAAYEGPGRHWESTLTSVPLLLDSLPLGLSRPATGAVPCGAKILARLKEDLG